MNYHIGNPWQNSEMNPDFLPGAACQDICHRQSEEDFSSLESVSKVSV